MGVGAAGLAVGRAPAVAGALLGAAAESRRSGRRSGGTGTRCLVRPGPRIAPRGPLRAGGRLPCPVGLAVVFTAVLLDRVGGCLQLYVMSLDSLFTSWVNV